MDVDHALFDGGFGRPEITRTSDLPQMVLFACRASGVDAEPEELARRLQHAWITHGRLRTRRPRSRSTAVLSCSISSHGGTPTASTPVGSKSRSGDIPARWPR